MTVSNGDNVDLLFRLTKDNQVWKPTQADDARSCDVDWPSVRLRLNVVKRLIESAAKMRRGFRTAPRVA